MNFWKNKVAESKLSKLISRIRLITWMAWHRFLFISITPSNIQTNKLVWRPLTNFFDPGSKLMMTLGKKSAMKQITMVMLIPSNLKSTFWRFWMIFVNPRSPLGETNLKLDSFKHEIFESDLPLTISLLSPGAERTGRTTICCGFLT